MKNKGFTLVELLVTIIVLGIIMGLSFPIIRHVQTENNKKKYETYAEGMVSSARLYVDSYDEDLFGHHDTGCAYITYQELLEKKLLDEIPISNANCDNEHSFIRIVKLKNQYAYSYSLECVEKKEKSYSYPEGENHVMNSDICRGREGSSISVELDPSSGYSRRKKSKVTLTSPTGIHHDVVIYATWIKGDKKPSDDSEWTRVGFEVPNNQEETILGGDIIKIQSKEIISPAGDGEYQFWIRIDELKDIYGEKWDSSKSEDGKYLHIGPFHLDNTPPVCTYSGEVEENAWSKGSRTITIGCRDEGEGASGCKPGKDEKAFIFSESVSKGTASYTIYDIAGNRKKCERSDLKVYIDNTAPTCTLTGPSTVWTNGNRTITWGCDDKHSGCAVGYSGGSKVFSTTTETANIASYEIRDKVGNKTTCTAQKDVMVRVDKEAPNCTNDGDSTSWTGSNRTITWGCVDNEKPANLQSGCATGYSGSSRTYSTTTRTASIGGYTIRDKAGNQRSCSERTANVYVDKTAPSCTNSGDSTVWANVNRTIYFGCSDANSGCAAGYTGGSKVFSTDIKTSTIPAYVIRDIAGNQTNCPARTTNLYIDKTGIVLQAKQNPLSLGNQDYNFSSNLNITYGLSGGTVSCNPQNSKKQGSYPVICTSVSGSGVQKTVSFTAQHSFAVTGVSVTNKDYCGEEAHCHYGCHSRCRAAGGDWGACEGSSGRDDCSYCEVDHCSDCMEVSYSPKTCTIYTCPTGTKHQNGSTVSTTDSICYY